MPSVTCTVWPIAWACQAFRAPGANRTTLTRTRDGSSPRTMTYLVGPLSGAVVAAGIAHLLRGPGGGYSGTKAA